MSVVPALKALPDDRLNALKLPCPPSNRKLPVCAQGWLAPFRMRHGPPVLWNFTVDAVASLQSSAESTLGLKGAMPVVVWYFTAASSIVWTASYCANAAFPFT